MEALTPTVYSLKDMLDKYDRLRPLIDDKSETGKNYLNLAMQLNNTAVRSLGPSWREPTKLDPNTPLEGAVLVTYRALEFMENDRTGSMTAVAGRRA